MLKKLKAKIKIFGVSKVANDLGYRSTTTVYNWLKKNEIPRLAKSRVKIYLESFK